MLPKKKKYQQKKYFILTKEKLILFLIFPILAVTIYFILKGNFFRIKKISCQINQSYCSPGIEENFYSLLDKNIFLIDLSEKTEKLKDAHPDWQTLKLSKKMPHEIAVEILTLQPVAALGKEGEKKFYLIDQLGNLVDRKEVNPGFPLIIIEDLPQVELGQPLSVSFLSQSLELVKLLTELRLDFKNLKIQKEIIIAVFAGFQAFFSPERDLQKQVASLQLIINEGRIDKSHLQEIDLRFEKPVIKMER